MAKNDNPNEMLESLRAQFEHLKTRSEELLHASSGLVTEEQPEPNRERDAQSQDNKPAKRVLMVSFDGSLCDSRRLLLERLVSDGLEVVSAIGMREGKELCRHPQFDLLMLCNSIPTESQLSLVREFRKTSSAPTLSIYSRMGDELVEADYRVDASEGPPQFLSVTSKVLNVTR